MIFTPEQFGSFKDFNEVADYLNRTLQELTRTTQEISEITLEELFAQPDKVQHGKLYFADGTDWDPGSGRGVYLYDSTGPTWRFLG